MYGVNASHTRLNKSAVMNFVIGHCGMPCFTMKNVFFTNNCVFFSPFSGLKSQYFLADRQKLIFKPPTTFSP
jgi:hypothetical protein